MKVIVLGVGIIGIVFVWFLKKQGYDVIVIDCQFGVVQEISFVNGCQILVLYVEFWVNLVVLMKVFKWLGKEDVLLFYCFCFEWLQWKWVVVFLCECIVVCIDENICNIVVLCEYSCQML